MQQGRQGAVHQPHPKKAEGNERAPAESQCPTRTTECKAANGTAARRSTGRLEDGRGQGLSIPGKEGATKAASALQEGIERLPSMTQACLSDRQLLHLVTTLQWPHRQQKLTHVQTGAAHCDHFTMATHTTTATKKPTPAAGAQCQENTTGLSGAVGASVQAALRGKADTRRMRCYKGLQSRHKQRQQL